MKMAELKQAVVVASLVVLLAWCMPAWSESAAGAGPGTPAHGELLAERARTHSMLLVGELHGTREAPALVGALATKLSAEGPVVVALEISSEEQARVDAWLASDGGEDARRELLDSPFWRGASPDGRSSVAMLDLLDSVRRLVAAGRDVVVVCFDGDLPEGTTGDRDAALAHHLRQAHLRTRPAPMLVLTGNYHARLAKGAPWNPDMAFAGVLLRDLDPWNLDVRAVRGSAWVCLADGGCGEHQFDHSARGLREGLVEHEGLNDSGYRATLILPQATASPPAYGGDSAHRD